MTDIRADFHPRPARQRPIRRLCRAAEAARQLTLVVFTALSGLLVAPPVSIHPVEGLAAIIFIALGGGASGALNMWWDADIDAVMKRTAKRPIPSGKVTEGEALAIGVTLSAISVIMLWLATKRPCGGAAGLHDLLLCRDLFHVAEACDAAEHCDRWRSRCLSPDDRLGGCDR